MDEIDRQIVALLRSGARTSFQAIGQRVSLSAPAVKRRVDRLEADGVIRSYADGRIQDTGPLNTKRMPTVDEEFLAATKDFIDRQHKAGNAIDFLARNIWLLVPIQQKVKEFFADYDQFPHQEGTALNAGGINYGLLRQTDAMKRLKDLERLAPR